MEIRKDHAKMNFSAFGSPFQTALPSMHQFATKFADPVIVNTTGMLTGQNTVMITTLAGDASTGGIQYLPVSSTTNSSIMHATQMQGTPVSRIATLPVGSNLQVMNSISPTSGNKYSSATTVLGWENVPLHHFTAVDPKMVSVPYTQSNVIQTSSPPNVWPVRLINAGTLSHDLEFTHEMSEPQDLCKPIKEEKDIIKSELKLDDKVELIQIPFQAAWPEAPGAAVADYLSRLPSNTLPLGLHHILKYTDRKDVLQELQITDSMQTEIQHHHQTEMQSEEQGHETMINQLSDETPPNSRKKKKKQKVKEKKPRYRPGEIRLSTALDGSTLFCCPECHMAYPERFSLEQHLAGHKMERRFKCDVCGACLKRKEHLDQHKRGHSQERPFVCSICTKGFKRNEHLTRHYVIHSGDKSYSCIECGKAFSRKDHLHKHAQTHIAKRVKAEMSQQSLPSTPSMPVPAPIMS
ncbi:hypothetical protein B566_EDAN007328 [Ephemera danica]|nr:hypothetical protein B566_EDAN007328 [Ephemera danica]